MNAQIISALGELAKKRAAERASRLDMEMKLAQSKLDSYKTGDFDSGGGGYSPESPSEEPEQEEPELRWWEKLPGYKPK